MTLSPLEQFATPVVFPFMNATLSLTKLGLYAFLGGAILLGLFGSILTSQNLTLTGTRWTITTESIYSSISSVLRDQIGEGYDQYLPGVISIFMFILVTNLVSNVPYSFGIFTSACLCLGLSITIFLGVTIIGLFQHGITWFSFFVPAGTPLPLVPALVLIEVISYLARAFSLGVRLFANLVAGHILLVVLAGMIWPIMTGGFLLGIVSIIPFAIFTGLVGLELAVSLIQAYVFTLLLCSYIADAVHLH